MSLMKQRTPETTSKLPLTARQREALEFIRRCVRKRGYGPTVREIGDQMGIHSPNGVVGHLVALERKGFIHREANLSRSIMLVERGEKAVSGLRIQAHVRNRKIFEDTPAERLELAEKMQLSGEDFFLLRVQDDELAKQAIVKDDLLLIRRARTAADGETVVLRSELNDFSLARCKYDTTLAKSVIRTLEDTPRTFENSCSGIYGVMVAVIRLAV